MPNSDNKRSAAKLDVMTHSLFSICVKSGAIDVTASFVTHRNGRIERANSYLLHLVAGNCSCQSLLMFIAAVGA